MVFPMQEVVNDLPNVEENVIGYNQDQSRE